MYDSTDPKSDRRDTHWTFDKKVPMALIVTVLVIIGQQIYAQGIADERFDNLDEKVTFGTQDRIKGTLVKQMFITRDTKIQALKDDISEIKASVTDNNKLLIQILQNTHRSD